jgi:hypothetical protein
MMMMMMMMMMIMMMMMLVVVVVVLLLMMMMMIMMMMIMMRRMLVVVLLMVVATMMTTRPRRPSGGQGRGRGRESVTGVLRRLPPRAGGGQVVQVPGRLPPALPEVASPAAREARPLYAAPSHLVSITTGDRQECAPSDLALHMNQDKECA